MADRAFRVFTKRFELVKDEDSFARDALKKLEDQIGAAGLTMADMKAGIDGTVAAMRQSLEVEERLGSEYVNMKNEDWHPMHKSFEDAFASARGPQGMPDLAKAMMEDPEVARMMQDPEMMKVSGWDSISQRDLQFPLFLTDPFVLFFLGNATQSLQRLVMDPLNMELREAEFKKNPKLKEFFKLTEKYTNQ